MALAFQPNYRLWRLPNCLALDAAGVAVAWRLAIAGALGLSVSAASLIVLGLSVWLVYLGDRWLDARGNQSGWLPTQRHRFVAKHSQVLLALWLLILLVDIAVAVVGLSKPQLHMGLIVLGVSVLYTIGVQRRAKRRWTKEMQVALIFTVGVGAFFAGDSLTEHQWFQLIIGLGLFGLACFANCILLARWELDADRAMERQSLARALGSRAQNLRWWAIGLAVMGFTFTGLFAPSIMLGVYGFVLQLMDGTEWPVNPEDRRCIADSLLMLLGLTAAWLY